MANESASAIVQGFLAQFGLQSLGGWAWNRINETGSSQLVLLEMRDRPEYKTRFPGMDALAKKGRAISEAEYVSLEQSYSQVMRAAGIPPGFYDSPDDFSRHIANEVAPTELQSRVTMWSLAASKVQGEERRQLERLYGVDQGKLTAFFIDPEKALPLIQSEWNAARAAGAFSKAGLGELERQEAEGFGNLTEDQIQAGTETLVGGKELFQDFAGEDTFSRQEQLGAAFGTDPQAQQKLKKRQSQRKATFQGGGTFASGKEGISGLGSA